MRSIGTARERSIEVGADCARSMLAAKKRVDCMAAGVGCKEWRVEDSRRQTALRSAAGVVVARTRALHER